MVTSSKSLQSTMLAACAMLGGCVSIGRDAKPDFPPAIDPHIYDARIAYAKSLALYDRPVMSIGGARIAEGGIYVDLVLANVPRTDGVEPRHIGSGLGDFFSDLADPGRLIEIRDEMDQPVELRAMQRPRMGGLIMPGTCILYARSPQYLAEADARLAYVDVCMWRTQRTLAPGAYRMRLRPVPPDGTEDRWIWQAWGGFDMDSGWHTFDVDRAPRADE